MKLKPTLIFVKRIRPNVSMKYMQLKSADSHRFVYVVGERALLKSRSKLQGKPNSAMHLELSQG